MSRALIELADELRAVATTGLHYCESQYDRERYEAVLQLAARAAALVLPETPEEMAQVYSTADRGYATPKIDVRMAIFRDDRVLLVRERTDEKWALPGGYAEVGDSPTEGAIRETAEEACVEVRNARFAGIYDYRLQPQVPALLFHIYKLVFTGEIDAAANPAAGPEVLAADFFPMGDLPELSIGRTLPLHIEQAYRVATDPTARPWID